MCKEGYLFNKDIIMGVLDTGLLPSKFRHIKSEEDIREINILINPLRNSEFPLLCPLTNKVLNGSNSFVLNWNCGCLLYEKLMFPLASIKMPMYIIEQKRMKYGGNVNISKKKYKCPNCSQKFILNNLFQLNLQKNKSSREKREIKKKEQKIKPRGEVTKLGKRPDSCLQRIQIKDYTEPRFNEYLFNLELNPQINKQNLNFRYKFKSNTKSKKILTKDSEIRVRYRNSESKD